MTLQPSSALLKRGTVHVKQAAKTLFFVLVWILFAFSTRAQNAIVTENLLNGNPSSEWDINGAGDLSIQGFATDISYNKGTTAQFKINVTDAATDYSIRIFRLGYYQGNGARLIADLGNAFTGITQPSPVYETATGLTDCGNWSVSASWAIPANAVSGIYLAKLTRNDNNGSSHIAFVVRDDAGTADILFKTSDATWQAYNGYGGNSLYVNNSGTPVPGFNHATKVSYNRPFLTRSGGGGSGSSEDWLFNAEYPMLRWLERNGFNLSYTTDLDMDRDAAPILPAKYKILISVGHDEYWSAAERTKFENARNAGVHLAFFSGNEVYWKTRWENSIDGASTAFRTLVCYKEGTLGENNCGTKCDPAPGEWTGLWRDGCAPAYAANDGCKPENALTGQISWVDNTSAIQVPYAYKDLRLWRNTSIPSLAIGQTATLANNTLGYEWDAETPAYASHYPSGRILLSETQAAGKTHKLSLYKHSSGALVFGAGTVQWSWGLDENHDRGNGAPDARMQQATLNLFADMSNVQPATIQPGLVAGTPSSDNTAPSSVISSPIHTGNVTIGSSVTINGTCTDAGGGVVAGVEVSTDGGLTWQPATGRNSWSFSWTPAALGIYTIKCRGFDDSGNMENEGSAPASNAIIVTAGSPAQINNGPGGPILVISTSANPFSRFAVELLRAEGLNGFSAMDLADVNATVLNNYDVVILGEMNVNPAAVSMFENWVNAGGTFIAFRPDAQLSSLLGITPAGGTLSEKYLGVNTASGPGAGIVNQTIQFHGTADLYTLNGATALATLYSSAATATSNPAVTIRNVGSNGGQAISFTYDLARSIVYTRQGNPAWSGQSRDGQSGPIRSDNLFFGSGGDPDWIDFNKVEIPQADEQMHLLTNIIIHGNADKKPLPRFWFLPKGLKAAVVMTGDDHGNNGTTGRFNQYKSLSGANDNPAGVADWLAIRGSSYIYPSTPITGTQVLDFQNDGFDIGVHLNTGCANYTESSLLSDWNSQWNQMLSNFPGIFPQTTHRTHCVAWSDWATQAKVQAARGVRMDVNYYYWPQSWMANRVGMFTGSGMPMRFADTDGTLIDCYQVTTQMTDETNMNYTSFCNQLLDNAVGVKGYYGVFCANMHTDANTSAGSDAIITSALSRNIPVVSAKQMLEWVDGRNNSTFSNMNWNGNQLSFTITAATGSRNMKAMLPANITNGSLSGLTFNGSPLSYTTETIKGIAYHFFNAASGNYVATYTLDVSPPVISNIVATPAGNGTAVTITWDTDEPSDSKIDFGTDDNNLVQNSSNSNLITQHSITINGLTPSTTYYFRVRSSDAASNEAVSPNPPAAPLSFTTPVASSPCFTDNLNTDFASGNPGSTTYVSITEDGEVILKPVLGEEFSSLPSTGAWNSFPWTGGSSTVSGGVVSVDGARYNSQPSGTTYGPGSSLEFTATFGAATFQHVGYGGGSDATGSGGIYNGENPWAMFSTGNNASTLKARTYNGATLSDYTIPGSGAYIGTSHRYRIDWKNDGSFEYYVDGALVHTEPMTITSGMRPAISDYNNDGTAVQVNWIRMGGYPSSGSFESRVYDGGSTHNWTAVNWTADTPAGTGIQIYQRQGNTPVPDGTWTAYTLVTTNGASAGGSSRYIQYRADLSSSNPSLTPSLNSITINCAASGNAVPVVTLDPLTQSGCVASTILFTTAATGAPAPTVQWQVSTDNGSSWNNIPGEENDTLTILPVLTDQGKQYRAVWTNSEGADTSAAAMLNVVAQPAATIAVVNPEFCQGNAVELQLTAATGATPFDLTINGTVYNDITVGQTFARFYPAEKSVWGSSGTPTNANGNDGQPIETGVKFRSTVNGFVKGVRFYKGVSNTGTHTGSLWSASGTQLASAVFTGETASGWQEVRFSSPVYVNANTTYIASYHSPGGTFAITPSGLSSGITNGPLTALATGVDGVNGVYKYGASGFPSGGNNANYWVDVLFEELMPSDQTFNYVLSKVADGGSCEVEEDTLSMVSALVHPLPYGSLATTAAAYCEGTPVQFVFNPVSGAAPFNLVINGTNYNNITPGVPFASGITAGMGTGNISVWDNNVTGGAPGAPDNSAIELGLKFRTTSSGQVTGVRFYKLPGNTGTHTGTLWSATGTQLATVTFTGETASGWQQVNFAAPVSISPNTTYVISYFAPAGNYAFNGGYFTSSGVSNGPLTALASGVDGNNGVYKYGGGFPDQSFNNANYWVDVVFNPSIPLSYQLTSVTSADGCSISGSPLNTAGISVNAIPAAPVVSSPVVYCQQATATALTATGQNLLWYETETGGTGSASAPTPSTATADTLTYWVSQTVNGCESPRASIEVMIKPVSASTTHHTACNSYTWNGNTYTTSGIYTFTTTNAAGCDSVATLNLTINYSSASNTNVTACNSYTWNGNTYTTSGTYTYTTTNAVGCDSVATLNLTINYSSASTTNITACNSYTWNGNTYTTSGTYTYTTTNAVGCDSVATLNLTINNSSASTTNVTACNSYLWNGTTYTTSGVYTFTTTNAMGCDSVATLNLTINYSSASTTNVTACNSYLWNGTTYSTSGVYTFTTTNAVGCDSVATLNLTINYSSSSTTNVTACDSYLWNGNTYSTSGTYTYTTTNALGCDSVATLNLTINNSSASTTNVTACNSYLWNGNTYTTSGAYTYTTTNALGCDSVATLNLTIKYSSASTTNVTACNSYLWNGTTYNTSGVYTYTTTNVVGCDSVATLNLTINNSSASTTNVTACNSYLWNGNTYATSGTYSYTTTNALGCDSVATLNLTINYSSASTTNVTACNSYLWNGTTYTSSGVYTYTTTNAVGCDSVTTLNLTINQSSASTTNVTACNSFTWNGTTYTTSGVYTYTTTNSVGCDSVATLNLTINYSSTSTTNVTACNGYTWNGNTYTTSGTYTYTTTNAVGCDSVATLNLTINNSSASTTNVTACNSYLWNGTTYTTSGVYTYTTTNALGCDSVATLNLTINQSSTSSTNVSTCYSYTWNGTTYTSSGIYTYTTTNVAGCDSVATLNLTIKQGSSSTTVVTACDSYFWNGNEYSTSDIYYFSTTNAAGCDSVAMLDLTILNSTASTTSVTACNSYLWNGTTYTTSGVYTYNTINSVGCDSVATLNLTINYSSASTTNVTACNSYVWNGTSYTTSGVYTYTTTNAVGCDSVATLNLTINHSSASTTTVTACNSYLWNGTSYTTSGVYTYTTTNAVGCDSVATLNLTINYSSSSTTNVTACNSYTWNGNTYTTSGTYTYTTTNAVGCDSVATLNLTINYSSSSTTNVTACNSYLWNGTTYTTSGVYTYTTTNGVGCDSVATLNLTINYSSSSTTNVTACNSYLWNGTTYTTSGVYTYTTTNAVGCDSVATLNLTINHSSASTTNVTSCNSYLWNGTTYTTSGVYTYTTTNAVGCDSVATLNLTVTHLVVQMVAKTDVLCFGNNTGTAKALASGNNSPVSYTINGPVVNTTGALSGEFSNLAAGNYIITATDLDGCTASEDTLITEPSILFVNESHTPILCNGSNATVTLTGTGGTGPYIGTGIFQQPSGSRVYTVTDANGCSVDITVAISGPTAISAVVVKQPPVCTGDTDGSISVTGNGGTGSLEYSMDGGISYQSAGLFTGLAAGSYTIRIKDAAGCTKDTTLLLDYVVAHWTGAADQNWHNPANWNTGKVPDQFTHVVIDGGTPNDCLINGNDAEAASVRAKAGAVLEVAAERKLHIRANCSVLPPE